MTSAYPLRLREAAALLQRGEAARALAAADDLLRGLPKEPEALHLRAMALDALSRADEAVSAYAAAAAAHPQQDVVLANLGKLLRDLGRHAGAADVFGRAVAFNPRNLDALLGLGSAHRALRNFDKARAAFANALLIAPNDAPALNHLGNLEAQLGHIEEAAALFSRAIANSRAPALALVNRGAVYRRLGRLNESVADLRRAAMSAPRLPDAFFQLALTHRMLGEIDASIENFRRALALAPNRVDIHREFIELNFELGRTADMFAALDEAMKRSPDAAVLVLKGELSLQAGDCEAALACARAATNANRQSAPAFGLEAKALRATGRFDRALDAAREAVGRSPDDFSLVHLCCEIEIAAGHPASAAKRLSREAPIEHLQKHVALKATAMRVAGDPDYLRYYDYDRFTAQIDIDPPQGFSNIAAFNEALRAAIAPLHRTAQRPLDQTLFGGTQSPGRLWNEAHPVIRRYAETMLAAARRFAAGLPDDAAHPFLARKSLHLECAGAWSVILSSGGGHVDHIHPAGWISACYYVESPPEIFAGARAGFLRLGATGVPGLSLPAERYFPPRPGSVVFFPSYVWHGVEPFTAQSPRVTAPFDLAPAAP